MKQDSCPICGSTWLAETHLQMRHCLDCGADMFLSSISAWITTSKEELDKRHGPVALTRKPLLALSNEKRKELLDNLGL